MVRLNGSLIRHCESPADYATRGTKQIRIKMKSEIPMIKYTCPKCGCRNYRLSQIRVAHSLLTQLFDIQSRKYSAIICKKCSYTEFYNVPVKKITTVFDFLTGT